MLISRPFVGPRMFVTCLLVVAISGAIGCGDDLAGPKTYPVTGVVTLANQPVAGAVVTFSPVAEGAPTGAQATTDDQGRFDVSTVLEAGQATKRGLPAGEYRITVIKMETGAGAPSLDKPPKNSLPKKYSNPGSSGLSETVSPDQPNEFELRLDR